MFKLARPGLAWPAIGLLVAIVLVFFVIRIVVDAPHVIGGTTPAESDFEYRYVANALLAYAHIVPGVVYLLLAPLQLWRGFRNRHLGWHRRIGRVAIVAGLLSGVFAIAFGSLHAWGGIIEALAAVLFGTWFIVCLVTAYRAIRRRDVTRHRRWMIRAFAVGVAVGTIRIWIGLFNAFGLLGFQDSFAAGFWISLVMHAALAELWLRARPTQSGGTARVTTPT
jgi:uncharacterized membrane protein YozB (DUF420 family)